MRSLTLIAIFLSLFLIALLLISFDPGSAIDDRNALSVGALSIAVYLFVYSIVVAMRSKIKQ